MDEPVCRTCGAEWLAGTNYCRQCGAASVPDSASGASEQQTALLSQTDSVATQRFDPRPTGPDRGRLSARVPEVSVPVAERHGVKRRRLGTAVLLVVLLVGIVSAVVLVSTQSHSRTTSAANLIYPGALTVVDMTSEGGGRALHLETSDSLRQVEEWYENTLKPQKTVRLTSNSVVLKNDNTTATIAFEDNKTNILIKMTP